MIQQQQQGARSKSAVSSSVVYTSIMNNMSSLSRLFRSSPLSKKQLFVFPANNHVSDPIFPLASKIMPDDTSISSPIYITYPSKQKEKT